MMQACYMQHVEGTKCGVLNLWIPHKLQRTLPTVICQILAVVYLPNIGALASLIAKKRHLFLLRIPIMRSCCEWGC